MQNWTFVPNPFQIGERKRTETEVTRVWKQSGNYSKVANPFIVPSNNTLRNSLHSGQLNTNLNHVNSSFPYSSSSTLNNPNCSFNSSNRSSPAVISSEFSSDGTLDLPPVVHQNNLPPVVHQNNLPPIVHHKDKALHHTDLPSIMHQNQETSVVHHNYPIQPRGMDTMAIENLVPNDPLPSVHRMIPKKLNQSTQPYSLTHPLTTQKKSHQKKKKKEQLNEYGTDLFYCS